MKKVLFVLVIVSLLVAPVFAQGGKEEATKQIVLRLADNQPIGYPTVLGDEEFARLVELYSNGRIKVEVYPQGQLGDEKSAIEQVQFGGIDFTRVSISPLSDFQPLLNALQMPYLYRDADHMWKVLNGEIGDFFLNSMEEKGFVGLVYYDSGARSFYNTKKPIYTVADLRGMKIRVQESALMMGLVRSLGAVPTPMAYGDVYSALQTGVIDGAENNWPSYDTSSHYEVAKYYSLDEHPCSRDDRGKQDHDGQAFQGRSGDHQAGRPRARRSRSTHGPSTRRRAKRRFAQPDRRSTRSKTRPSSPLRWLPCISRCSATPSANG